MITRIIKLVILISAAAYVGWVLDYIQFDLKAEVNQLNEEIAIRDSYIEDLCTAIDEDKSRTECKDIMDANDHGGGR